MKRVEEMQNTVCPQGVFGIRREQALRPFGLCAECTHMSHMSCKSNADHDVRSFLEKTTKKGLQSF
ncbi:MAG: hypothetical protein FWE44_07735 [Defluviitaleaceae bacterium]|nr:hypothetical protein [Defluviitaleaceae bacterium]